MAAGAVILGLMENASRIADRIDEDVAGIVACWRASREGDNEDGVYDRMLAAMEELVSVFVGFLRSTETVETFSRGGATRTLVQRIAEHQHDLGRDAVGVIEDFSVLRRCIWRSVEAGVDLAGLHGGEVSAFFVKLMQASDWLTETGLEAFDAIVRREMEQALGQAAATDLVTGLPDRDQLNRLLLPRAIDSHERFSVAVFDVVDFTETVAAGKIKRARKVLRTLARAVQETSPQESLFARFGDDEVCVILPGEGGEGGYRLAERVLERLAKEGADFEVDVGVAEYPAHGRSAGELMGETLRALKMAKRVGGSGIVIAR
ncbi:MAG: GGDEF domain-containing protein [Actinomycetota bacterium]|nr:GGDEF domain-containing protein [Actinomycetota bacterium]